MAAFFLLFGVSLSRGAGPEARISAQTGVSVDTLQSERATTGLGWGELEKAHLLANASGKSFDDIVALHKAGEGWGKIAHENGLNLGKLVSGTHRSGRATLHNKSSTHGKSAAGIRNGHSSKMNGARSGPSLGTRRGPFHSMGGMGTGRGRH